MRIDNLLDDSTELDEEMLENPESFDFRPVEDVSDEDIINIAPDNPWMDSAEIDLENENVEVRFSTQDNREKYAAVHLDDEFSLIESKNSVAINGVVSETRIYYLVTDGDVFMYDGDWIETTKQRPLEIAREIPSIYEKALDQGHDEIDWGNDIDYVPVPEEDSIYGEDFADE